MSYIVNPADPNSPQDSYGAAQGGEEFRALKAYIQNLFSANGNTKNKIIGGDFDTNPWQRGTTFSFTASTGYTADRIYANSGSSAGTFTVNKISDATSSALTTLSGEKTSSHLELEVTVADVAVGAGELSGLFYFVEGYDWKQLAQFPCVLTFWHCHSKTGIYTVGMRNSGGDRSFTAEYTQAVANTWEKATIPISASPVAGTWNYTNAVGLSIAFNAAVGATYQTPKDIWTVGNYIATANQVNALDTVGNKMRFQYIQLESGVQGTAFERRAIQQELALCQRYFYKTFNFGQTPIQALGANSGQLYAEAVRNGALTSFMHLNFPVVMRTTPAITTYNGTNANAEAYDESFGGDCSGTTGTTRLTARGVTVAYVGNAGTTIGNLVGVHLTASAEF